jgi:arylsulfatase A-like enzyme
MQRVFFVLSLLAGAFFLADLRAEAERPNIILIFTDDQGYEDLGCFGSPLIQTPHLDRLAAEGRKFTSFYSASSVCSPSRAALMTGCYPVRVSVPGVLFPRHDTGLHPDEITVAEVLKTGGYATACIGKWHLGHKPAFLPTKQGFDSYFGIPYSNDMTVDPEARLSDTLVWREGMTRERLRSGEKLPKNAVPLMRDLELIEYPADQTTLTRRYTEEAVRFIEANAGERPFFLYLPHTMPHIPLFASEAFRGKSARGAYGDTIEEIDWSVGQLLQLLESKGIDDDTLVIFTSDNGPWKLNGGRGGSAYPLRGYKFSTLEGGMRVPCLMRWPGKIPAGTVSDAVVGTIDVLPTLAGLAGASVPGDRILDGRNIWPLMRGVGGAESPHAYYYFYKGNRLEAVRSGAWKLRRTGNRPERRKLELFDLGSDPRESINLAERHPERVKALLAQMEGFDEALKRDARPPGKVLE